ncbi:VRR-NUC domain-containing protein [Bradyrhizobium genosp. SA-3]|uniref:VRR-NUC domain-containing protein n=1 Tax=Bradyrhizobium genosp. SA-3 TaxID=508868 RepID=UPI001FE00F07|nr:VRR-NUC domain-containing protein [Bradyrhizobium genosp. SA-3]
MGKGNTPEGRVKGAVNKVLARYPESYRYMPVPYGYGLSSLDFLICHYGQFIAIETKAPGEKPTARQEKIIAEIEHAGGRVFVIDGQPPQLAELEAFLEQVKNASSDQCETQDAGGARSGKPPKSFPRGKANSIRRSPAFTPAASADGDVPAAASGLRGTGTDPDAL